MPNYLLLNQRAGENKLVEHIKNSVSQTTNVNEQTCLDCYPKPCYIIPNNKTSQDTNIDGWIEMW